MHVHTPETHTRVTPHLAVHLLQLGCHVHEVVREVAQQHGEPLDHAAPASARQATPAQRQGLQGRVGDAGGGKGQSQGR